FGPADVVFVEGIAAIDDNVVRLQQAAETLDRLFGDPAGRQHHPDGTRLFPQRLHHLGERSGGRGTLLRQRLARLDVGVEHHAVMPRLHQAARHIAAHVAEADHTDLHLLHSLQKYRYWSAASIARASSANPASTSLRCTRSARRPRSTSTSRSPRACAAFTTPKL